jgi:hypothetical protein
LRIAELDVKADSNRFIRVYGIGDIHLEKVHFDEKRLKRYIRDIVSDPHGVWVFTGDAVEGRTPDMAKYDADVTLPQYKNSDYMFVVQEKLRELFEPLRSRPGAVVKGNHDEFLKWSGISNFVASISGGAYLDGEGLVRVNADLSGKSRTLVVYARHVISGGKTAGAKLNAAQSMDGLVDADVYMAGHIHNHASTITPKFSVPRRGTLSLVSRDVAHIIATSFLKPKVEGFVDYTGKKGYPPPDQGLVYLNVDLENMRMYRSEMQY